jgi:NAD(P)-dependent dehydrogenase (short-subunit alcohol dehydrogenase family)
MTSGGLNGGSVALVTGASRGAGRGIALELGATGRDGLCERPECRWRYDDQRRAWHHR